MKPAEAIEWLLGIESKYIHGGDEHYDCKRKEAIATAISALKDTMSPDYIREIRSEARVEFAETLMERYWQEDGCWLNIDICNDVYSLLEELGDKIK